MRSRQSRYVAGFIGDINILEGTVSTSLEGATFAGPEFSDPIPVEGEDLVSGPAALAIRPEKLRIALDEPPGEAGLAKVTGRVWDIGYLGDVSIFHVRLSDEVCEGEPEDPSVPIMRATIANTTRLVERPIAWNDQVWLSWDKTAGVVLTQ
jgi:putrescine transport system ATP-binding protein